MEISKIINRTEKKLDLSEYGQGEFVTMKVFPLRARQEINKSRVKGLDFEKIMAIMAEKQASGQEITEGEIASSIKVGEFDPTMSEFKFKVLEYGLDPRAHSFVDKGNAKVFDKAFFEVLATGAPAMFEYIVSEVLKFQDEYLLGERTESK